MTAPTLTVEEIDESLRRQADVFRKAVRENRLNDAERAYDQLNTLLEERWACR